MNFTLTLTLIVTADTAQEAHDVGIGAAEHLLDTFNDDGSLSSLVYVQVSEESSH